MEIILIVLCTLLLANIILLQRKVRSLSQRINSMHGRFKALLTTVDDIQGKQLERIKTAEKDIAEIKKNISDMEKGLSPDYEAVKKANEAVNDFSKGIAGILGFDPFAALHKDEPQEE